MSCDKINVMLKETNSLSSNYWNLESDVSNGFNRLKAKIYNVLEASILDGKQLNALKGLVKGFANDEYNKCIENMRYDAIHSGFIEENKDNEISIPPLTAEPLEIKEIS